MSENQREARFLERLRAGYGPDPAVGADLERRVLARARASSPRRAPWALWIGGGLAAAAAAALLVWARPAPSPDRAPPPEAVAELVLALETQGAVEAEPYPGEYALLADVWDEESELF